MAAFDPFEETPPNVQIRVEVLPQIVTGLWRVTVTIDKGLDMGKRKKKHLEIGTTISQQTVRRYKLYDLVVREWADGDGGSVRVREDHTKSGHIIDQQRRQGGRTGLLKFIIKHGIRAEPILPDNKYCSIGLAPDGTWYGWSHRAITGFKPMRDHAFESKGLKDDTSFQHSTNRLIKTDRGARGSAIRFSRYVS